MAGDEEIVHPLTAGHRTEEAGNEDAPVTIGDGRGLLGPAD